MSCSGASMNASGASLFTKRPTSRGGGSITGKIGAGSKPARRSQKSSNKRRTKPPSANVTDSVSSVATLLQHTTMFPSKQLRPQQQQRTVLSRRENILPASSAKTTSTSLSCARSSRPASRIRELHAGGWGGRGAGGIKDGFVNIKVKDLRTGRSSRIAEYCRGKVCVVDFWMSRSGGSSYVSMDA